MKRQLSPLPPMPEDLPTNLIHLVNGPPRMCRLCRITQPVEKFQWDKRQLRYCRLCTTCQFARYTGLKEGNRQQDQRQERMEQIKALIAKGHTALEIAGELGINRNVVYQYVRNHGLDKPVRRRDPYPNATVSAELVAKVVELYKRRQTPAVIAKILGISRARASYIIYEKIEKRYDERRKNADARYKRKVSRIRRLSSPGSAQVQA